MDKSKVNINPVNIKSRLKIVQDREIPHILSAGEIGAVLELIVTDKNGVINDKRIMKSESFVRQFLELLYLMTAQPTNMAYRIDYDYPGRTPVICVRTIDNNYVPAYAAVETFNTNAIAGDTTLGIVVGSNNTAPTIDDYKLGTLIINGTSAGRLQYGAVTFGAPSNDALTAQFTVTRNFANGSAGGVTVNEAGIYCQCRDSLGTGISSVNLTSVMIIRDVIAGGILVPNGQTLTINYRIQTTL